MSPSRRAWAAVTLVYIAGATYQTLGIFREISAHIGVPLFASPATAPEIITVAAVPLSDYVIPGIVLAIIATLPPMGEAHVLPRIGSRALAVWIPARAAAPIVAGGVALWLAVCTVFTARAPWVDRWVAIDGIETFRPALAEALPAGSVSPLGATALALVNLTGAFLAVSLWAGLAATFLSRRSVVIGLFTLLLVYYASTLWEFMFPLRAWFGIGAVMRQFPPGISATSVLLLIGALPLCLGALSDAHRSGRMPARRRLLLVLALVVCGLTLSSGRVLEVTGDLGNALLLDLHGARRGADVSPSLAGLISVQMFSLLPAAIMLIRVEEYIAMWPMVHARGGGSLRWLLFMVRDTAVVAGIASLLPVAAVVLAALGQPRVLSAADMQDLGTVTYWVLSTVLQATLYAVVLCTMRLVSASISLWVAAIGILFAAPVLVRSTAVPVGLNHLLVLEGGTVPTAVHHLAVLSLSLVAVCTVSMLAVKNHLITPEV